MRIRWTPGARRDLEEIDAYIALDSPSAATRVSTAIFDQTDALAFHPHLGRPGRVPDTRELVINSTPYIVPYRVRDQVVELLAVIHGAQNWPGEFG
jgi:toxin ParE1/3/4